MVVSTQRAKALEEDWNPARRINLMMSRLLKLVWLTSLCACGGHHVELHYPSTFADVERSRESVASPLLDGLWEANVELESSQKLLRLSTAVLMTWYTGYRIQSWPTSSIIPESPCIHRSEEQLENGHRRYRVSASQCHVRSERLGDVIYDGEFRAEIWGEDEAIHIESPGWSIESLSLECRDAEGQRLRTRNEFRGVVSGDESWFGIDVVWQSALESCRPAQTTGIRYEGHFAQTEGRYELRGHGVIGNAHSGVVEIESNQVGEPRECMNESLSGWTRITSRGHTAEVRYDGESECTDPPSAALFVDGTRRGTTTFACAAQPGRGPTPWALALLFAGILGWRARNA
ncbi:MAG: hypothetical protein ACI9KE_003101 [Polyangiales bacterium]|jgi:hypothetical protein